MIKSHFGRINNMKVFFNEDMAHFWMTRYKAGIVVNEQVLRDFIRQYEDTDVTDFVLNVNSSVSTSESQVFQTISEKYVLKEENGVSVDYTDTWAKPLFELREQGIDPFAVWIETIRLCNMRPWISIRMNDIHNAFESKAHLLKSIYCEQHPERWICGKRGVLGYFDKCLNYLRDDVQEYMLRYIEEQLSRYDVDGVELDFSREPFCFPAGYESQGRVAMLDFMRKVKQLVSDIACKREKRIKINMLCPTNPITAFQLGLDVAQIAKCGYVDSVVAGPRWATINLDVPLEIWRNLVGDKIEIGAIQQLLVTGYPFSKDIMSDEAMAFGQAAAFVAKGADLIYFYNLFDTIEAGLEGRNHPFSIRMNPKSILQKIGKTSEMRQWTRRCPLTYDDFVGLSDPLAVRLPMEIGAGGGCGARVVTGKIFPTQKVYVNIETAEPIEAENFTVYVNGEKAEYSEECMVDPYIVKRNGYSFALQIEAEISVVVESLSKEACKIEYMEVLICGEADS